MQGKDLFDVIMLCSMVALATVLYVLSSLILIMISLVFD